MRLSIEKKMKENLINEEIELYQNEVIALCKKIDALEEFANKCVTYIQDGKTVITCNYWSIGKIKSEINDECGWKRDFKITKELFKNIKKSQDKKCKLINKYNKKIDKLNKKLRGIKND